MTTAEMDAKIQDLIRRKDYAGAACFIVDHGRSSLDLKIMIQEALIQVAAQGRS